jgi:hypothetical protein
MHGLDCVNNSLDSGPNDIWSLTTRTASRVLRRLGDARIETLKLEALHLIDAGLDNELVSGHDEDYRVKVKEKSLVRLGNWPWKEGVTYCARHDFSIIFLVMSWG